MQFSVQAIDSIKRHSECLVLPLRQAQPLTAQAKSVDKAAGGIIQRVVSQGDFSGKPSETLLLHPGQPNTYPRILLLGLGKNPLNEQQYQSAIRALAKVLIKLPVKSATVALQQIDVAGRRDSWCAEMFARLITEASYLFTRFKSNKQKPSSLSRITLATTGGKGAQALKKSLAEGRATGEGVNVARNLGDLPGNVCTPAYLATQARALARKHLPLSCKIVEEKEMRSLGMGSLLSVTAGTKQPAKLIVLNYKGGDRADKPAVLVGKGVTFDSGGISLKPGAAMDEMKYDMCGAASVLGAVTAVASMQLPVNLVGIIPAVENMPSGAATKPGDIVTSMSGQTIEILNTDAEGRLILCDALTYAKRFDPEVVVDVATLTGACVIALGNHATAMYSNDDELARQLLSSGIDSADRCWQMPLWPEYDKQLKSNFADMANIGGRNAGSVTAACFLARFTKEYRWAHLDIAGSAWNSGANKGATGRPVPMLVNFIRNMAS